MYEELTFLMKRTDKESPRTEDLQSLRNFFDGDPQIALQIGNTSRTVFNEILQTAVGKSAFTREATERYIKNMKTELGYFSPTITFVEKMLIDEIIMRWLRLQLMENSHFNSTTGQHSMREGEYCEKRLHLTQKRYLQALETLAKVRKLIAQTQAKGARMLKDLVTAAEQKEGEKD